MDSDAAHIPASPLSTLRMRAVLSCVLAGAIAQLLSFTAVPPSSTLWAWLPGAALVGMLLAGMRASWLACALATFFGSTIVAILHGVPWLDAVLFDACAILIAMAAARVLEWVRMRCNGTHLISTPLIVAYILLACVIVPVALVLAEQATDTQLSNDSFEHAWHLYVIHCTAFVLIVPLMLGWKNLMRAKPLLRAQWLAIALLSGAMMSILAHLIRGESISLEPLPLALMFIWLVVLLRACGTTPAFLALFAASWTHARLAQHLDPGWQIIAMAAGVALLLLTSVIEQRNRLRDALSSMQARLGDLAGRMLVVQEEERSRIARDLHDDINQSIAAISIQISALKKELDASGRIRLSAIQEQLLDVSATIRQISHDVHPSALRYTSLAASLLALCQAHSGDASLHVECHLDEDMPLSNEQKLHLYRIAQEAIHNVESHAFASVARIILCREGNEAVLRIEDNGVGVPADLGQRVGGGLGMISMGERARSAGGSFEVTRQAKGGSRLEVRVPMEAARMPDEEFTRRTVGSSS